jgi:hypothetical protein
MITDSVLQATVTTSDSRWPRGPVVCVGLCEGRAPFLFALGTPSERDVDAVIADVLDRYPASCMKRWRRRGQRNLASE